VVGAVSRNTRSGCAKLGIGDERRKWVRAGRKRVVLKCREPCAGSWDRAMTKLQDMRCRLAGMATPSYGKWVADVAIFRWIAGWSSLATNAGQLRLWGYLRRGHAVSHPVRHEPAAPHKRGLPPVAEAYEATRSCLAQAGRDARLLRGRPTDRRSSRSSSSGRGSSRRKRCRRRRSAR
jgi:hypothetical protein